jgi:hypothetical protein
MANVDRPNGLHPVKYLSGAPYNGAANMYLVPSADATALFVGDPVKVHTAAGIAGLTVNGIDCEGMLGVVQATANAVCVGVVVGFLPDFTNLALQYRTASTNRIALVADDPNLVFEIQEVSGGTALASTEVGLNADFVVGSGNTTTGASGVELNNASEATTAGLNCRILGLSKRPDNNYGEHAKWLVTLNSHSFKAGVAGV